MNDQELRVLSDQSHLTTALNFLMKLIKPTTPKASTPTSKRSFKAPMIFESNTVEETPSTLINLVKTDDLGPIKHTTTTLIESKREKVLENAIKILESKVNLLTKQNTDLEARLALLKNVLDSCSNEQTSNHKHTIERRLLILNSQNLLLHKKNADLTLRLNSINDEGKIDYITDTLRSLSIRSSNDDKKIIQKLMISFESIVKKRNIDQDPENEDMFNFTTEFLAPNQPKKQPSLLDNCNDVFSRFNLRHVARLEGHLLELYESLFEFKSCIENSLIPNILPDFAINSNNKFVNVIKKLDDSMNLLASVSVLVPLAPSPPIKKCMVD